MIVSRLRLQNWRNFRSADLTLGDRVFLVGPNASGKSNLLDALRFLRDLAKDGGGLQKAVRDRLGVSKIRCLSARRYPDIEIEVELSDGVGEVAKWRYAVGIRQEPRGRRLPILAYEKVWREGVLILERPDQDDRRDPERLTETHLEQTNANQGFREVARFFESVLYLHLVPQLVKFAEAFSGPGVPGDPFGRSFLERIAAVSEKTRMSRLRKIEKALKVAVPQMKDLSFLRDEISGTPHLEVKYENWRSTGARQREDQFSDGTLRLMGLLWALLEGDSLLLLEEPELSLNAAIVRQLPAMIHTILRDRGRQVVISSHSADLLGDEGIGPEEVFLLQPGREGTTIASAAELSDVRALLDGGISLADVVLAKTSPPRAGQLSLFDE